jgi:hypothetical protein
MRAVPRPLTAHAYALDGRRPTFPPAAPHTALRQTTLPRDCTRIRLVAAPLSFEKRDHIAIEFAVPRWMNKGKSKLKGLSQFRDEEAQLLQFR